ncbi:DUF3329 domain-containing protein [Phyllobacterium myrsinacearum]|uniref:DUF3329 domain-containing protein n=1 Tax=Phyllobacterium myrsinacearum TaxID=28101 RepID=A0A839EW79_9HYPH|nr:DUF3329 domain-containing protein [Phyllobacterium myrsinacearum]MBA8880667.1 hypothetical protein [Phyllobacterium myrsinacearum]
MTSDSKHPFFRPLWRRVAVVVFCFAWAIFEFVTGTPFWGTIALGFAGYGIWQFFIAFDASEPVKPADADEKEE